MSMLFFSGTKPIHNQAKRLKVKQEINFFAIQQVAVQQYSICSSKS
jgi:hypothetical protein